MDKMKPFDILNAVWKAFKRVNANRGAAGRRRTIGCPAGRGLEYEPFYRLWNRLSSGSYVAPPCDARRFQRPMARQGL
jgi:hypothetical protein